MKRFHEYNLTNHFFLERGQKNSIADVALVEVGHFTKIDGGDIRTGVTIIDPNIPELFSQKLPCAIAIGNGFGKIAGYTQIEELGNLEAPIALTNTLSVGPVTRGIVDLILKQNPNLPPHTTINAIVGETNDGFLNNIHKDSISKNDVEKAYQNKKVNFEIGNVGAGVGTRCFSWKGGIGTSSRVIPIGNQKYTLGVLAQTNFGGSLMIGGIPIGKILGKNDFQNLIPKTSDGSCMMALATNAPLSARQLKRIAKRTFLGLARTGSILAHGSGDYAIAFSTQRDGIEGSKRFGACLKDEDLNFFFLAAIEATEESVYDALFAAETMTGRDRNALEALPKNTVIKIMQSHLEK